MKNITIHIVDDEAICIRELQEKICWDKLGIDSVRVIGSTSARMAKSKISLDVANIIISDIEMPGESGLDFTEWMTEWGRFSEHPVVTIMLTCHPEYQFIRRAMQLGCIDYVLKPVDISDMERVIQKAIDLIEERGKKQVVLENIEAKDEHTDVIYGKVIPYIEKNLTESFSIDDIAKYVALNPQYMMRLFKKTTGKSVLTYITELRMEKAKELLIKTDCSIENITEKIGYFSVAHFSQLFKKIEGITPGKYRKNFR